jgi:hypothetical protein
LNTLTLLLDKLDAMEELKLEDLTVASLRSDPPAVASPARVAITVDFIDYLLGKQ